MNSNSVVFSCFIGTYRQTDRVVKASKKQDKKNYFLTLEKNRRTFNEDCPSFLWRA